MEHCLVILFELCECVSVCACVCVRVCVSMCAYAIA